MRSRQPSPDNPEPRSDTSPQLEQIRAALRAYYEVQKAKAVLGYEFTWNSLRERIAEDTGVTMDADTLRQFALGAVSRGRPRGISRRNLQAIVEFLCQPDVGALSREELEEPDIPYRFARQFMEFLRHDEHSDLVFPPPALAGTYRAIRRAENEISDVHLAVTLSGDGQLIHLAETAEIFVDPNVSDPANWSPEERKRHLKKRSESRGWGVVTPEDNLLGFMKRVSLFGANHYYATMGGIPDFTDGSPVERLALLEYDYPYFEIGNDDKKQWFQDISQKVISENILHFERLPEIKA